MRRRIWNWLTPMKCGSSLNLLRKLRRRRHLSSHRHMWKKLRRPRTGGLSPVRPPTQEEPFKVQKVDEFVLFGPCEFKIPMILARLTTHGESLLSKPTLKIDFLTSSTRLSSAATCILLFDFRSSFSTTRRSEGAAQTTRAPKAITGIYGWSSKDLGKTRLRRLTHLSGN